MLLHASLSDLFVPSSMALALLSKTLKNRLESNLITQETRDAYACMLRKFKLTVASLLGHR